MSILSHFVCNYLIYNNNSFFDFVIVIVFNCQLRTLTAEPMVELDLR